MLFNLNVDFCSISYTVSLITDCYLFLLQSTERENKHHPEEEKQGKPKENTEGNIKHNIQYNRNTCKKKKSKTLGLKTAETWTAAASEPRKKFW